MQIELDPLPSWSILKRMVLFPLKKLLFRIDAHVEVIKQQVVIGAIRPVRSAQKIGAGCPVRGNHGCGEYQEQAETKEREEFQTTSAKNN